MEILRRQIAEVRRRLFIGRFASAWPWCATTLLAAAAVWIAVDRYIPLGARWYVVLLTTAVFSFIVAGLWAWLKRPDEFRAALELDRRCGLQERVSSTWALRQQADGANPAVEAVGADAAAALAKVDVAAAFTISPSRRWAWPLVPFTAAVVLALLPRPATTNTSAPPTVVDPAATADIRKAVAELEKTLEQKRSEAEKLKLAEAQRVLESLQQQARQMASDTRDRKEALVKMNDLIAQAESRRQTTDSAEEIKKQLSRLKSKRPGPADQLAAALGSGDFKDAADEAERLSKKLNEKLDAAQQAELSKQLSDLQDEVGEQTARQKAIRDQLQQQSKDSSERSSATASQLAQSIEVGSRLGDLQRALDAAAKAARQGDAEATRKALDELKNQLAKLDRESQENRLMEAGAKALVECKGGIAGRTEGGRPGTGAGSGALLTTKAKGQSSNRPGGLAPGTSTADPTANGGKPPGESTTGFVDRRAPQTVGTGGFRVVGATGGPNAKGEMLEAIREQAAAVAERGESQTLENQPLERARRDQRQQYFDALRKPE